MVHRLLDWIYPPKCGLCGALGETAICQECFDEMEPGPSGQRQLVGQLDWVASTYLFDGRSAQAVRRLKYSRVTSLAGPMSAVLEDRRVLLPGHDVIVPVPIHPSRLRYRGFNQAKLLCSAMPQGLVHPLLMVRTKKTRPQVELDAAQRLKNLDGAFRANQGVQGLCVLLVDDVVTTGGTGQACASALKMSGAREVGLLTFCGERPDTYISGLSNP
ncbi:MAG: ComF family protein [Armatimonadetes bacterium]|nr:ComF family protein [Armatimonadota bacterium]